MRLTLIQIMTNYMGGTIEVESGLIRLALLLNSLWCVRGDWKDGEDGEDGEDEEDEGDVAFLTFSSPLSPHSLNFLNLKICVGICNNA